MSDFEIGHALLTFGQWKRAFFIAHQNNSIEIDETQGQEQQHTTEASKQGWEKGHFEYIYCLYNVCCSTFQFPVIFFALFTN